MHRKEEKMYTAFEEKDEISLKSSLLGIKITTASITDRNIAAHWHDYIEVLYCLNGEVEVSIEKKKYMVASKRLIVIDAGKVHKIRTKSEVYMFMVMHISKRQLMTYIPDIDFFDIDCHPLEPDDGNFDHYLELCKMAAQLTIIDFDSEGPSMKSDGIALLMLSNIFDNFAIHMTPKQKGLPAASIERIHTVLTYVEANYQNNISLQEVADMLGFNKEYFCHYFKKYMGVSFLSYVNEVRITHAYQELINTDNSITEIMEHNGWNNQKVFNRTFKEVYGCTPREARKAMEIKSLQS